MAAGKAGSRRGRKHRRPSQDPHYYTKAGPVRTTRPDGSTVESEALSKNDYAKLIKERWPISLRVRERVFRRDRGRCRYCGNAGDVIDHVVPVALGGTNHDRNLVVACTPCNSRKGAEVWQPYPLTPPR